MGKPIALPKHSIGAFEGLHPPANEKEVAVSNRRRKSVDKVRAHLVVPQ